MKKKALNTSWLCRGGVGRILAPSVWSRGFPPQFTEGISDLGTLDGALSHPGLGLHLCLHRLWVLCVCSSLPCRGITKSELSGRIKRGRTELSHSSTDKTHWLLDPGETWADKGKKSLTHHLPTSQPTRDPPV